MSLLMHLSLRPDCFAAHGMDNSFLIYVQGGFQNYFLQYCCRYRFSSGWALPPGQRPGHPGAIPSPQSGKLGGSQGSPSPGAAGTPRRGRGQAIKSIEAGSGWGSAGIRSGRGMALRPRPRALAPAPLLRVGRGSTPTSPSLTQLLLLQLTTISPVKGHGPMSCQSLPRMQAARPLSGGAGSAVGPSGGAHQSWGPGCGHLQSHPKLTPPLTRSDQNHLFLYGFVITLYTNFMVLSPP